MFTRFSYTIFQFRAQFSECFHQKRSRKSLLYSGMDLVCANHGWGSESTYQVCAQLARLFLRYIMECGMDGESANPPSTPPLWIDASYDGISFVST